MTSSSPLDTIQDQSSQTHPDMKSNSGSTMRRHVRHGSNFSSVFSFLFTAATLLAPPSLIARRWHFTWHLTAPTATLATSGSWFSPASCNAGEDSGQRAAPSYKAVTQITHRGPCCAEWWMVLVVPMVCSAESWWLASDKESRILYFRKDNDKPRPCSKVQPPSSEVYFAHLSLNRILSLAHGAQ